ncbi:MAG: hypothetical protein OHK93_004333 [Ramalina farinacea]|uniref:DUF7730 domain-containing protein n=1 Tax=Ramalina farinacea TaxID=258253 RepID=A0AA43QK22_9LECA|nr:hypothetical protein [Ramalina farinacea]
MAPPHRTKELSFLSLPPDARHRIYELLLTSKPLVMPDCRPAAQTAVTPSILRTSRQIHPEASPILYRENTFLIAEPERILHWFHQMGPANLAQLRRIRVFVHAVYATKDVPFLDIKRDGPAWYELLDCLARRATGLRHVFMYWDAAEDCNHMGAGKDVRFVRELARIQGLERMEIAGFYAMGWPRYLAEKMGVAIQQEGDCTAYSLQRLRRFQRGTEGLLP